MPLMTPYRVAEETFVIPSIVPAPFVGNVHLNTMVIRAKEPVVVDTGMPVGREEWQRALWSIVDPQDVRWIFLSHEDGDHTGSLFDLLDACPNARLVTSWFELGRMEVGAHRMPDIDRCVWVDEAKWSAHVDRLQALPIETIVTAHGPAIPRPMIDEAFRLIREVPRMEPWTEPTQADLELLLSAGMSAGAHHIPMLPPSARRPAAEPEPVAWMH